VKSFVLALLTATQCVAAAEAAAFVIDSATTQKWNRPHAAQKIYGNTYYVGTEGLSSILIKTDAGLFLLDGDLVQSAPLIEANLASLGLDVKRIKYIANSHAHFDHAGGIAGLQRDSSATVLASPSGAKALREGHAVTDDPQFGYSDLAKFPPVSNVRTVRDGETIELGNTKITAHFTPGHTPGSTTWTWQSCEAGQCLDIVYADSLNSISAPGFRYTATQDHADVSERFRTSIRTVAALPCDIMLTVHPDASGMLEKLARLESALAPNPFIDKTTCVNYAASAGKMLEKRIADEKAGVIK
jgi:metallo-beta-lactamase class B